MVEVDKKMAAKVLTGAAAGVGIVAMAPIFGAIGTITTLGGVVGSILGASANVALSYSDEAENEVEEDQVADKAEKNIEVEEKDIE